MIRWLAVGAGGFVGATFRWLVAGGVQRLFPEAGFPWGTFAVNALGCLALGFLAELAELRGVLGVEGRLFLLVGVLGGFTTFSTFGWETVSLLRDGSPGLAAGNAAGQVLVGLAGIWLGMRLAHLA
ncbi:MAG: fluoride efflux transporter CrcB [Acidobacteriota bacterium]